MKKVSKESKLAKKLRLGEEKLSQDQKELSDLLKSERADRVPRALVEAQINNEMYYKRQHICHSRVDPEELALTISEAEAELESEGLYLAEQRLRKAAQGLMKIFSTVSGDKLTIHAAERMIERDIGILEVVKRSVTVIDKPSFNGGAVIVTTY